MQAIAWCQNCKFPHLKFILDPEKGFPLNTKL